MEFLMSDSTTSPLLSASAENGSQKTVDLKHFPLPIIQAERPLFLSRHLLEGMSRDIAQGYHPYLALSEPASYAYQVSLHLLAEIYRERKNSAASFSMHDLFEVFQKMPLFFNHDMVKKWEVTRVWAQEKFGLPVKIITDYSQVLDSATPSDAYQAFEQNHTYLWKRWFESALESDIVSVIDESANKWHAWEKQRYQYEKTSSLYHNGMALSHNLGLSERQCLGWMLLEQVLYAQVYSCAGMSGSTQNAMNNLWTSAFNTMNIHRFLGIINQALHLPDKTLESLFYSDSPLVKKGFLPDLASFDFSKMRQVKDFIEHVHCQPIITRVLFTPVDNSQEMLFSVATPYINKTEALPLSSWPDAQMDIEKAQMSLSQNQFPKILIYGLSGAGKSSLITSLLKNTSLPYHKMGWVPNFEDTRHSYGEEKKNMHSTINASLFLLKSHIDNVLIFDGNTSFMENEDNKKIIEHVLYEKELAQIWVVDNLNKINADIFNLFDMAIYVGEMNSAKRLEMARKFFQSEDIAYRISQSTRTPGDITKLANWCMMSSDYSWKNISHFLSTRHRLNYSAKGADTLLKEVAIDPDLVELAGYPEMEQLLQDLADYFNHPDSYRKMGAKIPKGILLTGESGTGKTHFAKHLTTRIGLPLYMVDTSRLAHDISLIAATFDQARQKAPCILFMDEIDSLINHPAEFGALNLDKQKVLNAFLNQLDGIHSSEGVLVIGATHRDFKPDPAATRAGRLGQHINLSMPHEEARKAIWMAHLKNRPVALSVDYDNLAQMSSSFSAAEIAEAINRASIQAAKERRQAIEHHHLSDACDEIFWGNPDNNMVLSEEEKEGTAIHETGHALIAMKNGFQVQRITVRPRNSALGAVQWQLKEGEWTFSREKLIARIELALGGIACEKAMFGFFKNGGTSDLRYTQQLLHHMLMKSGLGDTFGLSYHTSDEQGFWSEQRKVQLEMEERTILEQAMNNCCQWLEENKNLVMSMAHSLKNEREISGKKLLSWKEQVKQICAEHSDIAIPSPLTKWNQAGKPEHITIHSDQNKNNNNN
jgi:ATP-dependent Zn protease